MKQYGNNFITTKSFKESSGAETVNINFFTREGDPTPSDHSNPQVGWVSKCTDMQSFKIPHYCGLRKSCEKTPDLP